MGSREYNIRVLATIAQLAEHLIRNERVVGSNPISGSIKNKGLCVKASVIMHNPFFHVVCRGSFIVCRKGLNF